MTVCRTPEEVRDHLLNRIRMLRAQYAREDLAGAKQIVQARIAGIEEALECVQSLIDNAPARKKKKN